MPATYFTALCMQMIQTCQLSLNVKKSKYIVHKMTNKKVDNLQLNINGIAIEKVYDFNFLGLTLNENINWKNHIEKIAIKSSKIIGILNKLSSNISSPRK